MKKILTRPLNLKRAEIFTLNYDTLVEQACDAEGVIAIDGFIGNLRRIFRPESFDQDLYFPAQTTEGRVHRLDRVIHLFKLHGSLNWLRTEPNWNNPYGLVAASAPAGKPGDVMVYPTPLKYGETLGFPYSELFRRFGSNVVQPQSVLFVCGYGFGDDHVNAIIRQALAVPSFTLIIIDPSPQSQFVATLQKQRDQRVWIVQGPVIGTFCGFVDHLLPDLREEEILKKVVATFRSVDTKRQQEESEEATDGK